MEKRPHALLLKFPGTNCDVETARALEAVGFTTEVVPPYYSVKEAVLPFNKFPGVDPILGPEMKSTGEVTGTGDTFAAAFAKAQLGAGSAPPASGTALLSVRDADKPGAVEVARDLVELGFSIVATGGTAAAIEQAGIEVKRVNKVLEGRPHIVDMIKSNEISLVVNTTEGKRAIRESHGIRAACVTAKVTYYTTVAAAAATCAALDYLENTDVNKLQELHKEVAA